MISQERLKQLFHYNQESGIFTRLVTVRFNARAGTVAGCLQSNGYNYIQIDSKKYRAHRLAWLYIYGVFPSYQIDHINGVKDDNRITNLREATHSENQQNKTIACNNKSGFLGVVFIKSSGKFRAQIKVNGSKQLLGIFTTAEEASEAYCKAKAQLHRFNPVERQQAFHKGFYYVA